MAGDEGRAAVPFRWTPKRRRAVALVADGKLTDDEIAGEVGVKRAAIVRWKRRPEFAVAVEALVARAVAVAEGETIATKAARLAVYQRRHEQIEAVIAARAEQYAEVPGGASGLLVAEPQIVKVYEAAGGEGDEDEGQVTPLKQARVIYVYKVDIALLKEDRETLKQAAIERKEWVERSEQTTRPGVAGNLDLAALTDDELAELERLTQKASATEGGNS